MNILYLCADRGIPIRGHKGAAVHVRALVDAFVRQGHAVTLVAARLGPSDGPAPAATVIETGVDARHGEPVEAGRETSERVLAAALKANEQRRFDLIYERYSLWSDVGARLTRATGVPLVLEVNAPLRQEADRYRQGGDDAIAAALEQAQFTAARMVSVVSDPLRTYVIGRGADPTRVQVLTNGVDARHFHPAVRGGEVRGHYGLNDKRLLGFVGRPRPWHDLDTLLQALVLLRQRDPAFHLLLVGEMPDDLPQRLTALALTQAVTQTGPVAHDAVPAHVAALDVAVSPHPALSDFYFSPLKVFEYLACGVPTVAAAIGQLAELIRPGHNGALYPPGDAAALADTITRLLSDPEHARDMAWQGAVEVLTHHTWDGNARAVIDWTVQSEQGQVQAPPAPPPGLPLIDPKLRQRLYRATRPDLAAPLLARRLEGRRRLTAESIADIRVLKYKPRRRCVLAYDLRDGTTLIGKVFRDERGCDLLALQRALSAHGFARGAADGIEVAEGLAYVPEMRMLVQSAVRGETFNDLVAPSDRGPGSPDRRIVLAGAGQNESAVRDPAPPAARIRELAGRSAKALAKLHRLLDLGPDVSLPVYDLEAELRQLVRFRDDLIAVRPSARADADRLLAALQHLAVGLPGAPRTVIHRDFYYSQLLFDGPRLSLIDFDLISLGDPALDVANFSAHLVFLGLDRLGDATALAEARAVFIDRYGERRHTGSAFATRLAFYEAATFFRLLNVIAPRPGLQHLFAPILALTDQAVQALEAERAA